MKESTHHIVERWVGWALRIGVWSSATLMIAGLLLFWISGSTLALPSENPTPGELLGRLFSSSIDGITLMFSGLVLLMLTPFLRVITAAAGFLADRDLQFVAVSVLILAMLLGELYFSLW